MLKKIMNLLSNVFGGALFLLICLLVFIIFTSRLSGNDPTLFGYQIKSVLSGSMEPTFLTGSVIAIETNNDQTNYQTGDIITFHIDGKIVTHRITDVLNQNGVTSYETKGDNNNGKDLWTIQAQDIVGQYTGITIPYLGYLFTFTQSKEATALLLIIPGVILFISAFRSKEPIVKEAL